MAVSVKLPPKLRQQLKQSLEVLHLAQNKLADEAEVSQALVSNLLSATQPVRDPDRVAGVADALLRKTAEQRQLGLIGEEEAALVAEAVDWLRRAFRIVQWETVAPPGGPIPRTARNYVPRPEYEERLLNLLTPSAQEGQVPVSGNFTAAVQGPPHSGKTTLLQRLRDEATELGFQTAYFDCRQVVGKEESEPGARLFEALQDNLRRLWKPPRPEEAEEAARPLRSPVAHFTAWVEHGYGRDDTRRLLILDDLTSLDWRVAEELLQAVRNIHNERDSYKLQLSIAMGVTVREKRTYRTVVLSSVVAPVRIVVGWFTEKQVTDLLDRLGGVTLRGHSADLWARFRGQPYVTHVAASLLAAGGEFEEMYSRAITGRDDFWPHYKALRVFLGLPDLRDPGSWDLLRRIRDALPSRPWVTMREDIMYLRDGGLIEGDEGRWPEDLPRDTRSSYFRISSPYYEELIRTFEALLRDEPEVDQGEGDGDP